jgi:phage-related tail protein
MAGFFQNTPGQIETDAYTADALASKNAAEAAEAEAEAAEAGEAVRTVRARASAVGPGWVRPQEALAIRSWLTGIDTVAAT